MQQVKNRSVFQPDQLIFRQGEQGNALYVVEKGYVAIWVGDADSKTVLGIIPPGGVFGEMAIFDSGQRMANASAMEMTVLIRIPADRVRDAMKKADPIIEKLIRVMLDSARSLAKQVETLKQEIDGDNKHTPVGTD